MNAGKLVAEIAVLAIVVYCCYGAISDAVPKDVTTLGEPVDGLDTVEFTSATDSGLNIKVTVSGKLTNNLPQDLVDMGITIYLGSGEEKMRLASVTKTLASGVETDISETIVIPAYAIMAYVGCVDNNGTNTTLPICTKISFKYFEWQDSYLVDMSMTVKTSYDVGTSLPTVSKSSDGRDVTLSTTTGGILQNILNELPDGYKNTDIALVCDGASFVFNTDGTNITLSLNGSGAMTAEEVFEKSLMDNGKLTFTYNSDSYELKEDEAKSFLEVLDHIYGMAVA